MAVLAHESSWAPGLALADEASADKAYVGGLEREEQNPTIDMLERLAKVLGADIAEFFAKVPKGAPRPKPLPSGWMRT